MVQMMENAGRALAHLGRVRFFGGDPRGKRVTVLAGTGSNGGGAMACARRLQNWGARVGVLVTKPNEGFASVPAQQLRILRRMGVEVGSSETAVGGPGPDLIVDAHRLQLEGGAQGHGRRTHSLGRRPRRSRSCPGCSLRSRRHHRHRLRSRRAGRGDHDPGSAQRRLASPGRRGAGRRAVPGRHRRTTAPLCRTRSGPKGGPGLFTRTSMRPNSSTTSSTIRFASSSLETSPRIAAARPPESVTSRTAFSAPPLSVSVKWFTPTAAPSRPRRTAIDWPIPLETPVTITRPPVGRPLVFLTEPCEGRLRPSCPLYLGIAGVECGRRPHSGRGGGRIHLREAQRGWGERDVPKGAHGKPPTIAMWSMDTV